MAGGDVTELTANRYDPLDRIDIRVHRDYDDTAEQPFDCDDVTTGKRIEYDYDIQGNRVRVIDSDGIKTRYEYDARNRLETVVTEEGLPTEAVTTYTWWEDNLLKQIAYPNATVADRSASDSYDRADRVMRIVNRPADPGSPAFSIYEYDYDENGNRTQQIETQFALNSGASETTVYTFDNLNRLKSVKYGIDAAAPVLTYSYAPNGNRLTEVGTDPVTGQQVNRTYEYSELPGEEGVTFNHVNTLTRVVDQLDPSRTVTYVYDRNLNQVAKEKGGMRTDYHFGIRDQILLVNQQSGSAVRFDYDHERLRVKKIISENGKDSRYLYDQNSVLVEYDGTDATLPTFHKYDYGYELLSLTQVTNGGQSRDSEFYLTDGLMSTVNLTDESGELKQSYLYDAWGRTRDKTGTSDNPRQYTGHYKDDETGLHYFGARYYDDETGRFLSQDPYLGEATNPPSLHRYLYAYDNPLRYVDLQGYKAVESLRLREDELRKMASSFSREVKRGRLVRMDYLASVQQKSKPRRGVSARIAGWFRGVGAAISNMAKGVLVSSVSALVNEGDPYHYAEVSEEFYREVKQTYQDYGEFVRQPTQTLIQISNIPEDKVGEIIGGATVATAGIVGGARGLGSVGTIRGAGAIKARLKVGGESQILMRHGEHLWTVDKTRGVNRAFYQSSGIESKAPGKWFPAEGIARVLGDRDYPHFFPKHEWYIKHKPKSWRRFMEVFAEEERLGKDLGSWKLRFGRAERRISKRLEKKYKNIKLDEIPEFTIDQINDVLRQHGVDLHRWAGEQITPGTKARYLEDIVDPSLENAPR